MENRQSSHALTAEDRKEAEMDNNRILSIRQSNIMTGGVHATTIAKPNHTLRQMAIQVSQKRLRQNLELDAGSEEVVLHLCQLFIKESMEAACKLAKHRKSNTVEEKDLLFSIEKEFGVSENANTSVIKPGRAYAARRNALSRKIQNS